MGTAGTVNPRVDLAFKKIFGVEENKDLLIALINSIVGQDDQVVAVTLLNPYNPKNFKGDKLSVLDIKAEGETGKLFNIEIQIGNEADYHKRALYYWARLYTAQLKESVDYSKLSKAIGIHILNFTSIPNAVKYHNVFHITEKETGASYFKDLELHTIELNKFADKASEEFVTLISKIKSSLDIWVAFLTRHTLLETHKENLPIELNNPELKKAIRVLEVLNFDAEEREAYEAHLKWLRMQTSAFKKVEMDAETRGIENGLVQGQIIGEAIGEARGEAIGEARAEAKTTTKIAKNLLIVGIPVTMIAKTTGLSEKEIAQLKEENALCDTI